MPKNTSGFSPVIIIIVIVILIVLVGGGAYFLGFSKKGAETTTDTPTESMETSPTATATGTTAASPTTKPTGTATATATPTPTPTPDNRADLTITGYSFNHPPEQGVPFTISVTIKNQGNSSSGDFFWEWWATITAPTYACRAVVSSIASGAERTVPCTYTYGGWANYTTRAIADADNGVDESNEGNNTHSENVIPIH